MTQEIDEEINEYNVSGGGSGDSEADKDLKVDNIGDTEDSQGHEDLTNHEIYKAEADKDLKVDNIGDTEDSQGHEDLTNHEIYKAEAELPIEYLKNPETGIVFQANDDIMEQKHLIPCTKEGKRVPDTRRF